MACALALLALPAHAQQPAAELPAVTVRADGAGEGTAPLRPSAQAERERLERVPGGTNLALPQQESRLATLRDALDYQPGIVIQDFFGATDQPRLSIRGSGIQSNPLNRGVLLLQDGMPQGEADGSFIIGLIEPRNAALISARRGANTLTPGATTLGGEVDFQSLTGADERGSVRAEAGSFGRKALQGAVGLQGAQWDGRISVSGDRFDGYRHHSASQREALHANLGFQGAGGFENRTYLSWTDLDFDIPTVVPKDRVRTNPRGVMGDWQHAAGSAAQRLQGATRAARPRSCAWPTARAGAATRCARSWACTGRTRTTCSTTRPATPSPTAAPRAPSGRPAAGRPGRSPGARRSAGRAAAWTATWTPTNPANGTQMQRFGAYDLTADNLQAAGRRRLAPGARLDARGPVGLEPPVARRRQPPGRPRAGPAVDLLHPQDRRELDARAHRALVGQPEPQPGGAHVLGDRRRQRGAQRAGRRQQRAGAPEAPARHHVRGGRPGPLGRGHAGAALAAGRLPQPGGRTNS
ncbi:TonB-dependent receptor [Alicycliphilus sp. B1]|nr:TonB-dependent receptor [Alicycliphilus sp. B1]